MNAKIYLYLLVTILVVIAFDSININAIFKKNKVVQARIFYFFLALSMIYLVTNLIIDFSTLINLK